MKINPKSQKGAITLIVLVTMLFITAVLMAIYIRNANKAQSSAETTKQIMEQYNNIENAEEIYNSYFANTDIIPITTVEQLKKIGSGEQIDINGKIYTFSPTAYYTIQNDLDLGGYNKQNDTWNIDSQWTPLSNSFTGTLDGLGHTITGLYIYDYNGSKKGLFGELNGNVKNLSIEDSYIKGYMYIGSIAGINNGTIQNCHNEAILLGSVMIGGMAGQNNGTINVEYVENLLCYHEEFLNESNVLTINTKYLDKNKKTVVIPKGFNILKSEATNVEEGIVIQDADENEFVWIPVEKAIVTQEEIAKIKAKGIATTDIVAVRNLVNGGETPIAVQVDEINYKGILYELSGTNILSKGVSDWNTTTGQREPANLEDAITWNTTTVNGKEIVEGIEYIYDSEEVFNLYDLGTFTTTLYQDSFNNMAISVENYGGFFVGRYEMSLYEDVNDSSIKYAQSQKDKNQLAQKSWYELYKYGRDYSVYNTDLGVISEMIWGSQWDQMMLFINGKDDGLSVPFYVNQHGARNSGTIETKTGMNLKDKVANIFDIENSRYEWTQEARYGYRRGIRAGQYASKFSANLRVTMNATFNPTNSISTLSSRLSLYINGEFDKK